MMKGAELILLGLSREEAEAVRDAIDNRIAQMCTIERTAGVECFAITKERLRRVLQEIDSVKPFQTK